MELFVKDAADSSSESSSKESDEDEDDKEPSAISKLRYLTDDRSDLVGKLRVIAVAVSSLGSSARYLRADVWKGGMNEDTYEAEQLETCVQETLRETYGLADPLKSRISTAVRKQMHRLQYGSLHRQDMTYKKESELSRQGQKTPLRSYPVSNTSTTPSAAQANQKAQVSVRSRRASHLEAIGKTRLNRMSGGDQLMFQNWIPPPPEVKTGLKYFDCPYCGMILPRKKAEQGDKWRYYYRKPQLLDLQTNNVPESTSFRISAHLFA